MSLGKVFDSAATLLQERTPGLETGLSNVFQLNAANIPGSDIPGARLGLYNLQSSDSVAGFGNAKLGSQMMGLNIADLDRAGAAPAPAQGFNN